MHVSAGSYLTGTNVLVPTCVSPTVEEDGSGSRDEPLQPGRGVAEFRVDRLVNIITERECEINELTDDGANQSCRHASCSSACFY